MTNDCHPPYRPGGPWSALLDAIRIVELANIDDDSAWEPIAAAMERLAQLFELLPGCREQDLAQLFRAVSCIPFDIPKDEDDDLDIAIEHEPLGGD